MSELERLAVCLKRIVMQEHWWSGFVVLVVFGKQVVWLAVMAEHYRFLGSLVFDSDE